jgi:hypothetical protein
MAEDLSAMLLKEIGLSSNNRYFIYSWIDWNTTKPDDVSTLHFINKVIRLNTALSHAPSVTHTDDIDIQVSPLRPGQKYDNIIVIFYSWINKIPVVGRKSYFFEQHGGQIFCHFLSEYYYNIIVFLSWA